MKDLKLYNGKIIKEISEEKSWIKIIFTDNSVLSFRVITSNELYAINLIKGIC